MRAIKRTELKRGGPMKRSTFKPGRSGGLKSTKAKPIKSKGLTGRPPDKVEREYMEKIKALGCYCCLVDQAQPLTPLHFHHFDGRTKPLAHAKVAYLCDDHHCNFDVSNRRLCYHRDLGAWRKRYGTIAEVLAKIYLLIDARQPWTTEH